MKKIINFILVLSMLLSTNACEKGMVPTDCSRVEYFPPNMDEGEYLELFHLSKWRLYQLNLEGGDEGAYFDKNGIEKKKYLSSTNLVFNNFKISEDTITLTFFFEDMLRPTSHSYYYSYSYWGKDEEWGANYFERGGVIVKSDFLDEGSFKEYLESRRDSIAPWLNCMLTQ